jgi:phosphoribosylanthranilate isomerase
MLPIPVIAMQINHLTDARYFAAWLIDWMSFPLDGADAVRPQIAMQMAEWVEGPKLAARYEMTPIEDILQQWDTLPAEGLVLSGEHYLSQLALHSFDIPFFLELPLHTPVDIIRQIDHFHPLGIILFTHENPVSTNSLAPWQKTDCPIYVHIRNQSCEALWEHTQQQCIQGWAVSGAGEEKVGYKSFEEQDEVYEFLVEQDEL